VVRFLGEGQNGYRGGVPVVDPPEMESPGRAAAWRASPRWSPIPSIWPAPRGHAQFHVNVFTEDSFVRFLNTPEVVVTVTMKKK
jgi:hypothetical protein